MSVPTIATKAPGYTAYAPPTKADEQDSAQKKVDAEGQRPSQQQVSDSDLNLFRELFIREMAETEVNRDQDFQQRECFWDARSRGAQEQDVIQRNTPLTYQDLFLRAITNRGGYPRQEILAAKKNIINASKNISPCKERDQPKNHQIWFAQKNFLTGTNT